MTHVQQTNNVMEKISNSPFRAIQAIANNETWRSLIWGYVIYAFADSFSDELYIQSLFAKIFALFAAIACLLFIVDTMYVLAYPLVYSYYYVKK
jgi:hypothetical protein